MASRAEGTKKAKELFGKEIKGLPVREILAEQRLDIQHEYYLSITVDRSSRQPLILFTEEGGVDIEITAKEHPEAIRKAIANPLMRDIPALFMLRELIGTAPKEIGPIINKLYRISSGEGRPPCRDQPARYNTSWSLCSRCETHHR